MKMKKKAVIVILAFIILFCGSSVQATVGGPETITFLGYNEKEHRIYWLTYFHDEFGYEPNLSYIDFSTGHPSAPVLVDFWNKNKDRDDKSTFFASLTSKLIPLKTINSDSSVLTIQTIEKTDTLITDYTIMIFKIKATLKTGNLVGTSNIKTYINQKFGVGQCFLIPNTTYGITTFSFTGIPYESGYLKDTVVILK